MIDRVSFVIPKDSIEYLSFKRSMDLLEIKFYEGVIHGSYKIEYKPVNDAMVWNYENVLSASRQFHYTRFDLCVDLELSIDRVYNAFIRHSGRRFIKCI